MDGGTLLEIRSFRQNEFGQVAFQSRIDRNGDRLFTPGVDTAGLYALLDGDIVPLVREGERAEEGRVRGLAADEPLFWAFNDRAEVILLAGLDRTGDAAADAVALFLLTRLGDRLVVRSGQRTSFGTFHELAAAALSNRGEVIFPATLRADSEAAFGLFRYRFGPVSGHSEQLVRPGDVGPGRSIIRDILPAVTVTDSGLIGFCGSYFREALGIEGLDSEPAACFVQSSGVLYEVAQEEDLTPWGRVLTIDGLVLNDRLQAGLQVTTDAFPFGDVSLLDGSSAILIWENGFRAGLVGPGDRIPGGRVGPDTTLIGLSDNGWLAFTATVTHDQGVSRRGLFAAWLPE
jgi:hypothetical protein